MLENDKKPVLGGCRAGRVAPARSSGIPSHVVAKPDHPMAGHSHGRQNPDCRAVSIVRPSIRAGQFGNRPDRVKSGRRKKQWRIKIRHYRVRCDYAVRLGSEIGARRSD